MHFEYPLLEALAAVVREGTFEAAARALNITQSAVSQRLKLLEQRTGAVLVVRGRPCVATEYGQRLCRHVDQVQLLEHDLRKSLAFIQDPGSDTPAAIRVAVNRDTLATWFGEVIELAARRLNLHFDVVPDDQEYTAERLQKGEAIAAITTESDPLQGCRRLPLGALEYIAIATPAFVEQQMGGEVSSDNVASATCLMFDRKDMLPQQWFMTAFAQNKPINGHRVPSFSGYMECCLNGAGWGLNPRSSVKDHLAAGRLIELVPGASVVLPLYWQSTSPDTEIMRALSAVVIEVARKHLASALTREERGSRG